MVVREGECYLCGGECDRTQECKGLHYIHCYVPIAHTCIVTDIVITRH